MMPYLRAARAALDRPAFAAAWAAGEGLTTEGACALALEIGCQPAIRLRLDELVPAPTTSFAA
jgi:hypothetical protein